MDDSLKMIASAVALVSTLEQPPVQAALNEVIGAYPGDASMSSSRAIVEVLTELNKFIVQFEKDGYHAPAARLRAVRQAVVDKAAQGGDPSC